MKLKIQPRPESRLPLETVRIRNFKAIRDSGVVTFTPLSVFIGNNGSGKSSLIEGLETFQNVIRQGLDDAGKAVGVAGKCHGKRETSIGM